ncbi:MAG: hypothetical protein Ta2B_28110 [Termitinemataceae bacterium]|nr:MAG: hypothetical protein Ta2B_28110 [Termitinemataceae bacterium]
MKLKKVAALSIVAFMLSATAAFAEHPGGFGIGGQFGYNVNSGNSGGALALNVPSIPIFWAINLDFGGSTADWNWSWFSLGVSGDKYIIDREIANMLGWYLGFGIGVGIQSGTYNVPSGYSSDLSYLWFNANVRMPIGISVMPIDFLEIYVQAVPQLGMAFGISGDSGGAGFDWGVGANLGIKVWF